MKSSRQKNTKPLPKTSKKRAAKNPYSTREDLFEADVSRLLALLRANGKVIPLLAKDTRTLQLLNSIEGYFNDK
jgi:hypothetical protein